MGDENQESQLGQAGIAPENEAKTETEAPKPKKKSSAKKTPTPKPKAEPTGEAADPIAKRKDFKRTPMHLGSQQSIPKEARDPDYSYRYCADYGKGKIERYLAAGWEYVLDSDGNKIIKPSGETLYLMRIPKAWHEEDKLAKQNKIIETNKKFKADHAESTDADSDDVPEYMAKGQNLL